MPTLVVGKKYRLKSMEECKRLVPDWFNDFRKRDHPWGNCVTVEHFSTPWASAVMLKTYKRVVLSESSVSYYCADWFDEIAHELEDVLCDI